MKKTLLQQELEQHYQLGRRHCISLNILFFILGCVAGVSIHWIWYINSCIIITKC